jgi:integrase
MERKSDWHAWKTILREAGPREVRLHDGRHTAATLLLSEGVHPRVVMEELGHSQTRTTTDTYSHVMPALGRDAADRMGRALWDGAGTELAPVATTVAPKRLRPLSLRENGLVRGWS